MVTTVCCHGNSCGVFLWQPVNFLVCAALLKDGKEVTVLNPAQVCAFGYSFLESLCRVSFSFLGQMRLYGLLEGQAHSCANSFLVSLWLFTCSLIPRPWNKGRPGNETRKNQDTRLHYKRLLGG